VPRNLKIVVAYDGGGFHGWQIQPQLPTIQGELQRVLEQIEGRPVAVAGSGRTDAGVHALAQVASFRLENPIPETNLRKAMNRLLPPAIRVLQVEQAPGEFHARFSAKSKLYEYRIWRPEICPPMLYRYVHHHPYPLEMAAMTAAAPLFEGTRDFQALAAADDDLAPGPRTIFSSRLDNGTDLLCYRVRGTGFLRHMVRNMVGTLLEVGKSNLRPDEIPALLEAGDRSRLGPTVAAKGLFLVQVGY